MKYNLSLLLKVAITVLILAAFIWKMDFSAVLRALSSISLFATLAAIVVVFAQTLASASRLSLVVRFFGRHFVLRDSLRVTIESMFFSQTFVSFVGGDALRIWRIHKIGLSGHQATEVVLLDRLVGIIVNHCCLLASLPWLLGVIASHSLRLTLIGLAICGVIGTMVIGILGLVPPGKGVARYLPQRIRSHKIVSLLLGASTVGRHFFTHWRGLLPVALLALLTVFGNGAIFFLILRGMGADSTNAFYCMLLVPAILEVAMLPISIAGWGVREATTVIAFSAFGIASGTALASSLAFGFILAGVSLLGGVVWLFDDQRLRVPS